jgi:hypothetical protein
MTTTYIISTLFVLLLFLYLYEIVIKKISITRREFMFGEPVDEIVNITVTMKHNDVDDLFITQADGNCKKILFKES